MTVHLHCSQLIEGYYRQLIDRKWAVKQHDINDGSFTLQPTYDCQQKERLARVCSLVFLAFEVKEVSKKLSSVRSFSKPSSSLRRMPAY